MKRSCSKDVLLRDARTPHAIQEQSFALIEAEIPEPRPFSGHAWQIARRVIHAAGDTSLLDDLVLPEAAINAGLAALAAGAAVYTDTEMVRAGIPLRRLSPFGCTVECVLSRPGLAVEAAARGVTLTRAGFEALGRGLEGSVAVIGNAPTALLALLDYVEAGGPPPALVVGMPVGFVNAMESKELLLQCNGLQSLILRGRRGGSPLAAATVNALAEILLQRRDASASP